MTEGKTFDFTLVDAHATDLVVAVVEVRRGTPVRKAEATGIRRPALTGKADETGPERAMALAPRESYAPRTGGILREALRDEHPHR